MSTVLLCDFCFNVRFKNVLKDFVIDLVLSKSKDWSRFYAGLMLSTEVLLVIIKCLV